MRHKDDRPEQNGHDEISSDGQLLIRHVAHLAREKPESSATSG
jgi:hypothetical protein